MKNSLLLATALLALAPIAIAAPLDTKGIPADVQGVVHIDYDLCAKSALVTALQQQAGHKDYEALKTQFGFDPAKDLSGVTIGFTKPASESDTPAFFGVARGKFSAEKITDAAKQANARVSTEDGYTIIEDIDMNAAAAALGSQVPKTNAAQKNALCILDSNTLLFAQTKTDLAKVIGAYTGKAKSYASPAALDKLGKQTANPLVIGYLGSDITPEAREGGGMMPISVPKADCIYFSIAENSQNLLARVCSDFASADDAQELQSTLQMLMGLAQMGIGKAATVAGPKADQARMLQKLLASLQVNLNDSTLDISCAYPVADLVKAMQTYSKQFAQTAAED